MNIAFVGIHPYYGGLSNNGGSTTILRAVMILREMGYTANVVTQHKDKFTFFKHPKPIKRIPKDADVCIAISSSDIGPMLARMPKRATPFYWCRLCDANTKMPKAKLIRHASKVTTLVNSEGLRDWFKKYNVETKVAYQGIDFDKWKDTGEPKRPTLGFLISKKTRKHFEIVEQIVHRLGDEYDYVGYGASRDQNKSTKAFAKEYLSMFKTDASHADLCRIYNLCTIWVATSTQEGLHNPPIEAALCGCAVVFPDAPMGGCSDHCINGKTAWVYKARNPDDAAKVIRTADKSRNEAHQELIREKIGSRQVAMERLVACLSN